jgi:RNA recognition motif-containing protein
MSSKEEATAAMAGLNGTDLNGNSIVVNEARPREDRGTGGGNNRPRSGGGNYRKSW